MEINYEQLENDVIFSIRAIEERPHTRYIRYMLTKQILPTIIIKELGRLGLSKPTEKQLADYYINIIDPVVSKYGLSRYYRDYKKKLQKQKQKYNGALNFAVDFTKDDDYRILFCRYVREMDVEEMWSNEVCKYYGSIHDVPQDDSGERIIKVNVTHKAEKILLSSYRYILDSLLVEDIPVTRIVKFMKEKYNEEYSSAELYAYKKYFFNFKRKAIEERLEQLNVEKKSLESDLRIIDTDDNLSPGDKVAIERQYVERIETLDKLIKALNANYSELAFKQAVLENDNLENMFRDIVARGYKRFLRMDAYNDRDVVDPLVKITKMMGYAAEKIDEFNKPGKVSKNGKVISEEGKPNIGDKDKHAQESLFQVYKERYDEVVKEHLDLKNEAVEEDIGGLDELS